LLEDDYTTVWGEVEGANIELRGKVGQLTLGSCLQVDDPGVFCAESLRAGTPA
jgi:hypothetical protein